jgi:hypothetical protein
MYWCACVFMYKYAHTCMHMYKERKGRRLQLINELCKSKYIQKLTDDIPIKPRNFPDPKYKATASIIPIPTANSKAVDTEASCFLSATPLNGLPLVLPSRQLPSVQQSEQISTEHENIEPIICLIL